jgi:hypothetical protein
VAQQLRQDIATGKELIVCGAEPENDPVYAQALLVYAAEPTDENWHTAQQFKSESQR